MTYSLKAPDSWWDLSPDGRKLLSNGCGPSGIEPIIPDKLLGLSIEDACRIHDWQYSHGDCSKWEADYTFLHNMFVLIEQGSWWLRMPRLYLALIYFKLVRKYGKGG